MSAKSKLALLVALTAVGIASPAFAQSFDPDMGSGNLVAWRAPVTQSGNFTDSGLNAYAMIPDAASVSTVDDPAATGGGSRGYNENLLKNQW